MKLFITISIALTGIVFGQDYSQFRQDKSAFGQDYSQFGQDKSAFGQDYSEDDWEPYTSLGVVGQEGGCCLPDKMEAFSGMALASAGRRGPPHMTLGHIWQSVDATQEKTYSNIFLKVVPGGKGMHMQVFEEYKNKTRFIVTDDGKKCLKAKLGPWVKKCIPAKSHLLTNAYYGNSEGENSLAASVYGFMAKGVKAVVSVTREETCIPITESAWGMKKGGAFSMTIDFMNISAVFMMNTSLMFQVSATRRMSMLWMQRTMCFNLLSLIDRVVPTISNRDRDKGQLSPLSEGKESLRQIFGLHCL